MRTVLAGVLVGLGLAAGSAAAAADETLQLGRNPGECEIAAALGIAKPGCEPVRQRLPTPSPPPAAAPPPPPEPVPVVVAPPPPPPFTASFEITFEFGSARLTRQAAQLLKRIGGVLAGPEAAASRFRIVGHTDGVGRPADNLRLSRLRAAAVRDFLVRHAAMDSARFEVEGRGATELLNKRNPAAPENRRVDITNLGG